MYHRGSGLRRPELLGEVQVALETFELMNETRMWKNIEPKVQDEVMQTARHKPYCLSNFGFIQILRDRYCSSYVYKAMCWTIRRTYLSHD